MSRWRIIAVVVVIITLVGWLWHRADAHVIAEARSPSGEPVIRLREIQLHPASLGGLFRLNEKVYRCEYYPHSGWPMFSCETFAGESYEVRKVEIKWIDDQTAKVILDGQIAFECVGGKWHQSKP